MSGHDMHDVTTNPDIEARVRRWAYRQFVNDEPGHHLAICPDAAMVELTGGDGQRFCDTCGWSGLALRGVVRCPHAEDEWRLDESSADSVRSIAQIIDEIERQEWPDAPDAVPEGGVT